MPRVNKKFSSLNPATGQVVWSGWEAGKTEVEHAVAAARKVFFVWSTKTVEERIGHLKHFAKSVVKKQSQLAKCISEETGKPLWESTTEVQAIINKIDISIEAYAERCKETKQSVAAAINQTRFRPHGVVAVLGPFNLPGHLPNGHIVPALLAGNTVVFKPSEKTPLVGQIMIQIWEKIGLPKGVINLVQGGAETAKFLISDQAVDGVFFTGSARVGKLIHRMFAGRPEKILALEMGGNNPLIVHNVRDLVAAAYMTIESAFITSGQRCVSARRLIVPQGKKGDDFLQNFVAMTRQIKIGAFTERPEPFMGPVISNEAANNLLKAQKTLIEKGGKPLLLMQKFEQAFVSPGIIDMTTVKNRPDAEIFGPFLQVIRVKSFDEAIQEANNTNYGLAAGLLSDDSKDYQKFLMRSRAGIINWNRPLTGASSRAPFGGVGQSGNYRPSAYFAADYCSYPTASMEAFKLRLPENLTPGIKV